MNTADSQTLPQPAPGAPAKKHAEAKKNSSLASAEGSAKGKSKGKKEDNKKEH